MVGVSRGPTKVAPAPTADQSFPFVSLRFSSFAVVSWAFRLGSASISVSLPPRSCKASPIQAEWPQRHAPRDECRARLATFESFQITIGPNRAW